jgi:hypothetical protein
MEDRKGRAPAYRVEELAAATGVGVDTIRFYQGRGLLDAPERRGRSPSTSCRPKLAFPRC